MNHHIPSGPRREPTQGAEGLPRWRWTLAEFEQFVDIGVLREDDRVELIGGELVPMAAMGNRHEIVRLRLTSWLGRYLVPPLEVLAEPGWRPDDATYVEPDILVAEIVPEPQRVPASMSRLVIEIADASLGYDLDAKARIYAGLGVGSYWVINSRTLAVRTHTAPAEQVYAEVTDLGAGALLTVPGTDVSLRMADLGIAGE